MLDMSPIKRLLVLQAIGWFWYFIIVFVAVTVQRDEYLGLGTLHLIFETLFGYMSSTIMWFWFTNSLKNRISRQMMIAVQCCLFFGSLWTIFKWTTFHFLIVGEWMMPSYQDFGNWFLFSFAALATWSSVFYLATYYSLLIQQQEKTLKVVAASKEAELKMLRYQINPHFMLNAMNSISTLILKNDNVNAFKMVEKLSHFLSSVLEGDPAQMVSLEEELQTLRQYIDIQQVRFGDRLRCEFHVDNDCYEEMLPSLILQPLVENAVKYAVAKQKEGGDIIVTARKVDSNLIIDVSDNGPGMSEEKLKLLTSALEREKSTRTDAEGGHSDQENEVKQRVGIGISNTQERIDSFYGDAASLSFHLGESPGLTVRLSLPIYD